MSSSSIYKPILENSEEIIDSPKYSSFSHGNSLDDMMGLDKISSSSSLNKSKINHYGKNLKFLPPVGSTNENVNYLVILIGVICLIILFLPTTSHVDSQSREISKLHSYLFMTFEIKLFASFVLGMVTMVILRT